MLRLANVIYATSYVLYKVTTIMIDNSKGNLHQIFVVSLLSILTPFALIKIFKRMVEKNIYLVLAGIAGVLIDCHIEVPVEFRQIIYKIDVCLNLKLRVFLPQTNDNISEKE